MRGKGITYDTGFFPGGTSTRECFDPDVVRRELQIIAEDLHCNAVRITGGDPARLTIAGDHAAAAGLEVWFSPFPCELTPAQMAPYFAGWQIVDDAVNPPRLDGNYVRDEGEQVSYMRDLLTIFEQEGLDSAFWFTFAGYALPHRSDPRFDLDMASYGVVKILAQGRGSAYPEMGW
jgi:hypothetical protein